VPFRPIPHGRHRAEGAGVPEPGDRDGFPASPFPRAGNEGIPGYIRAPGDPRTVSEEFGRRLRDLVDGIRAEAAHRAVPRKADAAAAAAFRRHLRKAILAEAESMLAASGSVLAELGLRVRYTPEEACVEAIPGGRLAETHPPWLRVRTAQPGFDDARVVVVEVTWHADDPRTPLPEAPCTLRHVSGDDSAAGLAEVRDFLAVAFEEFAAAVARYDALPRA